MIRYVEQFTAAALSGLAAHVRQPDMDADKIAKMAAALGLATAKELDRLEKIKADAETKLEETELDAATKPGS